MASNLATVVVEPRVLVREGLKLLMAGSPCDIVCCVGSVDDIDSLSIVLDPPRLVILGADKTVADATAIRELWPDTKIILLYEHASLADFRTLLTSQIDGCVPVSASPDTLISILDMVVAGKIRVMVAPSAQSSLLQPASARVQPVQPDEPHSSEIKVGVVQSNSAERRPSLSPREAQILDGLVQGRSNKVIARTCDITEATVKVHLKSIMRKIRAVNRTQVAMWALANGYIASGRKTAGPC